LVTDYLNDKRLGVVKLSMQSNRCSAAKYPNCF
jgi:hypothetical protein